MQHEYPIMQHLIWPSRYPSRLRLDSTLLNFDECTITVLSTWYGQKPCNPNIQSHSTWHHRVVTHLGSDQDPRLLARVIVQELVLQRDVAISKETKAYSFITLHWNLSTKLFFFRQIGLQQLLRGKRVQFVIFLTVKHVLADENI